MNGATVNPAKLVWRRACESNGEMRTSRCVPASACNRPYAYLPLTMNVALEMPASLPSVTSSTSTSNPRRSAQRMYMRSIICAQSCASTPPAPEWISHTASDWSYSPENKLCSSSSLSRRSMSASASFSSTSIDSSCSSMPISKSVSASSTLDRSVMSAPRSSFTAASAAPIVRAFAGSSVHRAGSDISVSRRSFSAMTWSSAR